MIDSDLDLLVGFRSEVPLPDEETAERVYRRATTTPPHRWLLLRARLSRRARVVMAVGLAGLVLVPAAVAVGGRLAGWFQGKPAPASIRQDFVKFNAQMQQMSAAEAKSGLARQAPQAIASRAHGVLALRTADGPVYMWAAPRRGGGICWLIQLAAAKGISYASCDQTWPPDQQLTFGTFGAIVYPSEQFIMGRAVGGAASVVVNLSNGTTTRLPVVEGLFMGAIPKHVHPLEVASYNAAGNRLTGFGTLAGGTAQLSPAERRTLSRVSAHGTPFPLPLHNRVVRHLIAGGYKPTAVLLATRGGRNYFRFPLTNGHSAFGTGRVGLPSVVGEIVGGGTVRFPSADNPLLDMSIVGATVGGHGMHFVHVGGIAADGVARVVVKDREGRGLLWLPVRDNVYDSGAKPLPAAAVQLDAQDAQGQTVARVPR
jgi:hypothetical protein